MIKFKELVWTSCEIILTKIKLPVLLFIFGSSLLYIKYINTSSLMLLKPVVSFIYLVCSILILVYLLVMISVVMFDLLRF